MLFACGRDEDAEGVLSAAEVDAVASEDHAGVARIEIALADGAVTLDDDDGAHRHLAAAREEVKPISPSIGARAWVVEARLARIEGRAPPPWKGEDPDATQEELLDPSERIDLGTEVSLERAAAARLAQDWAEARVQLERARELASSTSSPRLIALAEIEIGLYAAEVDDPGAAYARIGHGIQLLTDAGLKRDAGRAMIRLAGMMAAKGLAPAEEAPALWLERARETLGEAATWRDRAAIRSGAYALTEETAARVEAFERARSALLSAISVSVESSSISAALADVDHVFHDLIDSLGATALERDKLRALLAAAPAVSVRVERAEPVDPSPPLRRFADVVGSSAALLRALAIAKKAATVDSSILITGERGTGKELVAEAIHTASARRDEPFVGLNVAALSRELLDAELFGYEPGTFAAERSEGGLGKLELAGGGTLLLEEISEMPLATQAKLLRVLKEPVVFRLGGAVEHPFRARIIATSRRDLTRMVEEGTFRTDLLYRLRSLSLELPPLRERPEDIAPLAQHYLRRFADEQRRRVAELAPAVLEELARYDWPGNVRELVHVIDVEVSLLPSDATALTRLSTRLAGRFRPPAPSVRDLRASAPTIEDFPPAEAGSFSPLSPILPLVELEKKAYLHALEKCNQNVARAAEALGVSKVTFYAKLRSWGMHPRDRFDDEGPTNVRRHRAASSPEPFEPPTRTSSPKIPTEK